MVRPVRVLVTGGAGFIGSHVVDALTEAGACVRVLDRRPPKQQGTHGNAAAEYIESDIRNEDEVARALEGVDAVSHQAAMVGLGVDPGDIAAYVSMNDVGTATLLSAMYRRGFEGRLVLASSMVVYGEGAYRCDAHGMVRPGPRDEARLRRGAFDPTCPQCGSELHPEAVTEYAPPDPRNVYAATKVHQEDLCRVFARETALPLTVLRYHNVYGRRMPRGTPYAGVAALFASSLASGRAPQVFEDGKQRRNFVHVRDVAKANVHALFADPPIKGVFNVAAARSQTVGQLADALVRASGPDAPLSEITGRYRLGDVRHVFASTGLAEAELGFRAEVPFDVGAAELAAEITAST